MLQVLGLPLDLSRPLERVRPLRHTTHLHQHDYFSWGDYTLKCRTSPPAWWNEHPATVQQDTQFQATRSMRHLFPAPL